MEAIYHIEITMRALQERLGQRTLAAVITANTGQDSLRYQFGHYQFHYDNNRLAEGDAYVEEQRTLALAALEESQAEAAWAAFGRLLHAAQDFYAHSNYVSLYIQHHIKAIFHEVRSRVPHSILLTSHLHLLPPEKIAPLDPAIISHPDLHSGRLYYPWEALSFLGLESLMRRLLPPDSHTRMNLDSPKRGPLFAYAFSAAVKRTIYEYEQLSEELSNNQMARFMR
jgi:hypothetical protein